MPATALRRNVLALILVSLLPWSQAARAQAAWAQSDALTGLYRQYLARFEAGSYDAALALAERAHALAVTELGAQHATTATLLSNLGFAAEHAGRPAEAEAHYRQALGLRETIHGAASPEVAEVALNLGLLLQRRGRYADAEPWLARVLEIRRAAGGGEPRELATALDRLATLYRLQGRLGAAEPLYREALALREAAFGPGHLEVAVSLNNLAVLYQQLGRAGEAEALYRRDLAIGTAALGPEHPQVAVTLGNLGGLLHEQGRLDEAEALLGRAVAIQETRLGPVDPALAATLGSLALLEGDLGRFETAEAHYRRALAIKQAALGEAHPELARELNNLATHLARLARWDEAEPLLQRALAIAGPALGEAHPDFAAALANLARLYKDQGLVDLALPLYREAIAVLERAPGPGHPSLATALDSLAVLLSELGHPDQAEALFLRALAIREAGGAAARPGLAGTLNNLAGLYGDQGRVEAAAALYHRSLAITEQAFGSEHPEVATRLANLAGLECGRGRCAAAEALARRALAIDLAAYGAHHPETLAKVNTLAVVYRELGRSDEARRHLEQALAAARARPAAEESTLAAALDGLGNLELDSGRFARAEALLGEALEIRIRRLGPDHPAVALGHNNLAALFRGQERLAAAGRHARLAVQGLRRSLGDRHPRLAVALANLAELSGAQGRLEPALAAIRETTAIEAGRPGASSAARAHLLLHLDLLAEAMAERPAQRAELVAEGFRIAQLGQVSAASRAIARMSARFAAGEDALAQLVRAHQDGLDRRVALEAERLELLAGSADERSDGELSRVRTELERGEARLAELAGRLRRDYPDYAELAQPAPLMPEAARALLGADERLLLVLVHEERLFLWLLGPEQGEQRVVEGLGRTALERAVTALRATLDPSGLAIRSLNDLPAFDTATAYRLYRQLLEPFEPLLAGARHLLVVPDGALQSLPLGVLLRRPASLPTAGLEGYRGLPWLARELAITTLPAVSSLAALRRGAGPSRAEVAFTGFGDPALGGGSGAARGVEPAGLVRGGLADVDALRRLAALPETAVELRAMAAALPDPRNRILLGPEATESRVKALPLADSRVLAFATHGLIAGATKGLAEPALVLTPPAVASAADDGLLTAGEIASQLELDADWVILSACNTASGERPGAESLSGLAKAFFYAGSRALLVSHWPVETGATVRLTTATIEAAGRPGVGRAEALRRAMVRLIDDAAAPHLAHPLFWAPFTLVGEGGMAPQKG